MDPQNLPTFSLRRELTICLIGYSDSADAEGMPILSPRGLLTMLNKIGPETGDRWLPLIEATLDAMWQEGLVGRIPAPSIWVPPGYCCRRWANGAIRRGVPVILLPRKDRHGRSRRPRLGEPSPTSPSPAPDRRFPSPSSPDRRGPVENLDG